MFLRVVGSLYGVKGMKWVDLGVSIGWTDVLAGEGGRKYVYMLSSESSKPSVGPVEV